MKRFLKKTAFLMAVLILMVPLAGGASIGLGLLMPGRPGPDGNYLPNDLGIVRMVPIVASLWIANRIASYLFWKAGISNGRWSLLARNSFNS